MSDRLVVGLMSGTSLDGVDAALVRIRDPLAVELVSFATDPYGDAERRAIGEAMEAGGARQLALLHVALGERFAAAVLGLCARAGVPPRELALVASHGHTVWHEPGRASWQLGDPATIVERVGVPVVSDFRARDVAAGGQGAPLVPLVDALLFGREHGPRVLLNLGGMANLTYVPCRGITDGVIAFDTGPGVAVIDRVVALVRPGERFDRDGRSALRGRAVAAVLDEAIADAYFAMPPPKSTGRERFGTAYAERLLAAVRERGGSDDDAVATATALTVRTVARALDRFVPKGAWDLVVSGGGARNPAIVGALAGTVRTVRAFDEIFFDGKAKEAVVFAVLGWLTTAGRAGNVPGATGARAARVLGSVTPV